MALFCFVFHQYDSEYKEEFPVEDWKLFLVLLQLILTRLTELQYLFYLANRLNTYTRQLGKVSKHPWERAIFGGWGLRLRLRWGLRLRFPFKERNKDTKKEQLKIKLVLTQTVYIIWTIKLFFVSEYFNKMSFMVQ